MCSEVKGNQQLLALLSSDLIFWFLMQAGINECLKYGARWNAASCGVSIYEQSADSADLSASCLMQSLYAYNVEWIEEVIAYSESKSIGDKMAL